MTKSFARKLKNLQEILINGIRNNFIEFTNLQVSKRVKIEIEIIERRMNKQCELFRLDLFFLSFGLSVLNDGMVTSIQLSESNK